MRFMMMVKASKDWEAGRGPRRELVSAMSRYHEELKEAGVLVDFAGLLPTAQGALVRFSAGKPSVIDGPFAETKEVIGGYWIIQVKSRQEALEWAARAPAPHGKDKDSEIEIRQIVEAQELLFRMEGRETE